MRRYFAMFAFLLIGCDPLAPANDTKEAAAVVKAEQLQTCARTYSSKHDGERLDSLDALAVYNTDGAKGLIDPWGQRFQFRYVVEPESHAERLVIWTVEPKSGRVLAAPPHLAPLVSPPN